MIISCVHTPLGLVAASSSILLQADLFSSKWHQWRHNHVPSTHITPSTPTPSSPTTPSSGSHSGSGLASPIASAMRPPKMLLQLAQWQLALVQTAAALLTLREVL